VALACGRVETEIGSVASSLYIEAESGQLSGGFTIGSDPTASGGEYIESPPGGDSLVQPGAARAVYDFMLGVQGTYFIWGRMHGPDANYNVLWVTVDQMPAFRWRLSTGVIWYWRKLTDDRDYRRPIPFAFSAGSHRIVINNAEPNVGLDRLYVSSDPDDRKVEPFNDSVTTCSPPDSIQVADGGCDPSCGSHGATACGLSCMGRAALRAYDCTVCCFAPNAGVGAGALDASAD
jgi:hypothetical protein